MSRLHSVRRFLDLSTAHLDERSRRWLTNAATDASTYEGCYGWFTCAYPDPDNPGRVTPDEGRPPVLQAIFEHAIRLRCDYVLFDRDAPALAALPVFEEESA